jgi:hypothetical protein
VNAYGVGTARVVALCEVPTLAIVLLHAHGPATIEYNTEEIKQNEDELLAGLSLHDLMRPARDTATSLRLSQRPLGQGQSQGALRASSGAAAKMRGPFGKCLSISGGVTCLSTPQQLNGSMALSPDRDCPCR